MKKLICTLLASVAVVGSSLSAQAQALPPQEVRQVFQDSIEGGIIPRQMIAHSGGGFIVAGSLGHQGVIARLSACGDAIWLRAYLLGDETVINGIAELPSGNLMAVGSCRNCAPGDTTRKALALLADSGGEALLDTTFGHLNYKASAEAVIVTADGKAALAGSLVWASFLSPTRAFLAVLGEDLQPELWKEFNELYYDQPQALIQTSDGGFALAGYAAASLASSRQAQLFRTDAQGELRWVNLSSYPNSEFNSVQEAPDGRIVALGSRFVDEARKRDVYLAVHHAEHGGMLHDQLYCSLNASEGCSSADDEGHSLHAVEGGYLIAAIWGEPSQPSWNKRDWIFRLDEDFDIVDQYLYDSFLFAHSPVNALPLSPDGIDFAYLSRLFFFESRYILFYKKVSQGRRAILSQAPQNYQLVPRSLETNKGTVIYQGELDAPGAYDQMRLDVSRNGGLVQTLYHDAAEVFTFQVDIPAELADYTFHLTGLKDGKAYLEAEACEVVAGDAYIIQGQSNAAANAAWSVDSAYAFLAPYNRYVRTFGIAEEGGAHLHWHREANTRRPVFSDTRSGQWGLVLGKRIAAEQGIPVAILNGGIGGIAIDNMLPNPAAPHSTAHSYGRFYQRVEGAGLSDHIRAILFFQGETNALPGYGETVASYKDKYLQLRSHWQADFSYEREYLFQIRPGCWQGNFHFIQEAQRQLALELPQLEIMSATGMNHDGCHYYFSNGYERAGEDIYRLLEHQLYGAPLLPDAYPPAVDSAWFSDSSYREITLRFRQAGDEYDWQPGWEADFRLEGVSGVAILAGAIEGHTLRLSLSDSISYASFSGLSYISHASGDEAPVKNANGIGMLAFYDFPVSSLIVGTQAPSVFTPNIRLFPNPATNYVTVEIPGDNPAGFELYDSQGRLLITRSIQGSERIALDSLKGSIYFYRLSASGWQQSGKLVKK